MPNLSDFLGIGTAQGADAWAPNRGTDVRVQSGGQGALSGLQQPGIREIQMARQELQQMGPPQIWGNLPPAIVAQRMQRMQELQGIIRAQQQ